MRLLLLLLFIGKGLTGSPTAAQMAEQGAVWSHHWSPCQGPQASRGCVDVVKGWWTLDLDSSFYGDIDGMRERLAACDAGWFMWGDEFRLQNTSMEEQVDGLARFARERDQINPDCRIAFGGVLPWHPATGSNVDWVEEFAAAYQVQLAVRPPIDAVLLDIYDWPSYRPEPFPEALAMIAEVKRVYGEDMAVIAREIGSLEGQEAALQSVDRMSSITRHLDGWAFFTLKPEGSGRWGYTALYDTAGNITELGRAYAAEPKPHKTFVPLFIIR